MNEKDRLKNTPGLLDWSIYNSSTRSSGRDIRSSINRRYEEEERLKDLFRRYSDISDELESVPESYTKLSIESVSSRYGISSTLADRFRKMFISDIDRFKNDSNYRVYSKYAVIPDAIFKVTTNPNEFFINPDKRFTLIASTRLLDEFFLVNGITVYTNTPDTTSDRIFFGDL